MRRTIGFVAMVFASVCSPLATWAVDGDDPLPGQFTIITEQSGARFRAAPIDGTFDLPDSDPREVGATIEIFDTGGSGGSNVYELPAGGWRKLPLGRPKRVQGYSYHGAGDGTDPCSLVMVMPRSVKANCYGSAVTLDPPFAGEVAVIVTIGAKRYCMSFGGSTWRNDERRTHRREAPAPDACPVPGGGGGTTTSTLAGGSTTTTTVGGGTTTTIPTGGTTTTTVVGETTTTSIVGATTSTTVVGATTSTTLLGATTTTTPTGATTTTTTGGGGGCCNGAGFVSFATIDQPGDCGDIIDNGGAVTQLACAGLYSGGGGNSVPLPLTIPDLGQAVSAITSCTGQTATLGGTTSAQTGSNLNCTSTGCLFGAPLAVPNTGSTPTSVCVINFASSGLNGMAECDTGATTADLPLSSVLYLTGDTSTDPSASISGIQPCPLCSDGTCIGGPNSGETCTAGTTDLGGDPSYPTSHHCPPAENFNIGTLPIAFSLSSGTVLWRGTAATNDTGHTASVQQRVFSGFCRDTNGTGAFQTPPQKCWENGVAVGAACAEPNESCEQRNQGAFGPNGGANRTILAIGSATSILGGSAPATLVSVFSIPPTSDATVNAAGDLPGPGAVALPGTASLCATASPCP